MKILEVGPGPPEYKINDPGKMFQHLKGIEIKTMDADNSNKPDYWHDITSPIPDNLVGEFDIVFASHVLEHIPRDQILEAAYNLVSLVKVGGELYIMVPALEWAAGEILANRETIMIQGSLYGGQRDEYDYHKVGFTLNWLRILFEDVLGLVVRKAYPGRYISIINDKEFPAHQNVIIIWKNIDLKKEQQEAMSVPDIGIDTSDSAADNS